jgi:hypothetical protein
MGLYIIGGIYCLFMLEMGMDDINNFCIDNGWDGYKKNNNMNYCYTFNGDTIKLSAQFMYLDDKYYWVVEDG